MAKVKVEQGWLEGELLDLVTGDGQYFSFKGVPYAAPPVGELRFKAPKPPISWEGVRKATEHGPICPQHDIFTDKPLPGSEDCLYLNVYTKDLKPKAPLPVMVFIHGGGFKSGSGNEDNYGPDFLVNHGVVLVTINYRLAIFGFLCLDTEDVPGNAGLKDQVAAFKWVQKNIASFGGDANNVTIFGESAGGASCSYHVLSPMSKGLFRRSIPMSGSPFNDWCQHFEAKRRAFILGRQLGFNTDDPKKLLEFLQSLPYQNLVEVKPAVMGYEQTIENIFKFYYFTPVVEKNFGKDNFLTENPSDIIKKGSLNQVDILIGYTDEECLLVASVFESFAQPYNVYPETLVPRKISMNCPPAKVLELSDSIRKHYFGTKPINLDTLEEFILYLSHSAITYDVIKFIQALPKSVKKYAYRFRCVSERNIYGNVGAQFGLSGASHLDDTAYLFDPKRASLKIVKESKAYKMIQLTCDVFVNFAKYGTPTPDATLGITWPEYDNEKELYVNIGESIDVIKAPDNEAVKFWDSIYQTAGFYV